MKSTASGVLIILSLALGACSSQRVSLDAIKTLASQVSSASTAFTAVSSDLYQSCLRKRETTGATRLGGLSGDRGTDLSEDPLVPQPPDRPSDVPSGHQADQTPPRSALSDMDCAQSQSNSQTWLLMNDFVVQYAKALGTLAGADTQPKGFDTLASSLRSSGAIGSNSAATIAADAVTAIGSAILTHERDKDILAVVRAADSAGINSAIFDPLKQADTLYYNNLVNERRSTDAYYDALISPEVARLIQLRKKVGLVPDPDYPGAAQASQTGPPSKSLSARTIQGAHLCDKPKGCAALVAIQQLRERIRAQRTDWSTADQTNLARFSSVTAYFNAMSAIERAHAQIAQTTPGGLTGLYQQLQPYVSDISDSLSMLKAATSATAK